MAGQTPPTTRDFIRHFSKIASYKHRYELFRDFVTMSAIAVHNAVCMRDDLEQEYLNIVSGYKKDDVHAICKLFGELVHLMDDEPRDVLGPLYMELDLGNEATGQFFTPPEISELMANMTYGEELKDLQKPFITLSEPACGAGGMVLAFAKAMIAHKHNPAEKLWVQCVDVDRLAALMCYLQLSLWNIPAQIVVGNSLSLEVRETFYTPAHHLGAWDLRLKTRRNKARAECSEEADCVEHGPQKEAELAEPPALVMDGSQFDFGF